MQANLPRIVEAVTSLDMWASLRRNVLDLDWIGGGLYNTSTNKGVQTVKRALLLSASCVCMYKYA